VHAIVRRSKGGIAVDSRPGEGTTFSIYLPCADGAARTVESEAEIEPAPALARDARDAPGDPGAMGVRADGRGRTILLAEDDEMFRGLLRQVLEGQGYRVLAAETPAAAREVAAADGGAVDLLLSDMIMPGGTGAELADDVRRGHPETKVVLMSGYTDDALASRRTARDTAADAFLEKPFATQELLRVLRELLEV